MFWSQGLHLAYTSTSHKCSWILEHKLPWEILRFNSHDFFSHLIKLDLMIIQLIHAVSTPGVCLIYLNGNHDSKS